MNYYLNVNNQVYGPYTMEQLQGFVASGHIVNYSMLSQDGQNWFRADAMPGLFGPVYNQGPLPANTGQGQTSTVPLILGFIGLITWLIPLFGFPVSVTGVVLSAKRHSTLGMVLNIIGLLLTLMNSLVGMYLGATGQLWN